MWIFTDRELQFLAGLRTSWRRIYWNEIVRLLQENDHDRCDDRDQDRFIAPPYGRTNGIAPN